MINSEIDNLVRLMSKLPGLGLRSARRIVLHLLNNKEKEMHVLSREIRISGNTNKSIAKDMSSHLKHWTGISWIVSLVEEQGSETLDEKKERILQEELESTKKTPEMEKVLKAFPNADLKSVKDIKE